MDFSGGHQKDGFGMIPNGQLAHGRFVVEDAAKASQAGGQYIKGYVQLEGNAKYDGQRVYTNIMDPYFEGNSEKARDMGLAAICKILETGNNAGPSNPAGYNIDNYMQLSGMRVAVKIKIVPPKDGFSEKNEIADWLSPNPESHSNKDYVKLTSGIDNVSAVAQQGAAPQGGAFAQPAAAPAPAAQAAGPFPQGQQPAPAQQAAPAQNAGLSSPQMASAPTASPSNQPAGGAPGWLAT